MAGLQSGEGPLGLFMGGDLGGVLEKAGVQALESQNLEIRYRLKQLMLHPTFIITAIS